MKPHRAFLALLLAWPCPGQDAQDLTLRVTAGVEEVGFGVAFPLTVERAWSEDLVPREWNDEVLAPLVVSLVDRDVQQDGRGVRETRTYRAWVFQTGDVTVPAPWFRARPRDGGLERVAIADDLRLEVVSALGAGEPGEVELPRGPFPPAFPWLQWTALGALAVAVLGGLTWRTRHRLRPPVEAPARPVIPPHVRALERLRELRARIPRGREEVRADSVEASALVRDYIEERFAVRAPDMTSEEFLAHPRTASVLDHAHRAVLSEFLAHCDLVKFARREPEVADRDRQLDAAEAFVRETSENGSP